MSIKLVVNLIRIPAPRLPLNLQANQGNPQGSSGLILVSSFNLEEEDTHTHPCRKQNKLVVVSESAEVSKPPFSSQEV